MRPPAIDDVVRLTQDLPNLDIRRGSLGIVRSTWFKPTTAYEVEFKRDPDHSACALVSAEQLVVDEALSSDRALAHA